MARGSEKRIPRAGYPLSAELPLPGLPFISGENLHFFCGRRPPGEVPLHRHDQLEINILFEPAVCRVSWGRPQTTATLTGPSIVVVSPRQWHSCCWEREAEVILLHLERPLQRELQFSRTATGGAHPFTSSDRVLWDVASGLRRLCLDSNPSESRALALVAKTVACRTIELIGAPPVALPAARHLSDDDFRRVEEYTLAHLGHPIQAGDAAKCVGYSLQHFNVLFKARAGITFKTFLKECRMAKAKELFTSGARFIKAVAEAVGYDDAGNFTALFRKHFGVSPKHVMGLAHTESAVRPRISSDRP